MPCSLTVVVWPDLCAVQPSVAQFKTDNIPTMHVCNPCGNKANVNIVFRKVEK